MSTRAIAAQVFIALLMERFRPRLDFSRLELAYPAAGAPEIPQAGEIGLVVRHFWRGRGEIDLALRSPRNSWCRLVDPLGLNTQAEQAVSDGDQQQTHYTIVGKFLVEFSPCMKNLAEKCR